MSKCNFITLGEAVINKDYISCVMIGNVGYDRGGKLKQGLCVKVSMSNGEVLTQFVEDEHFLAYKKLHERLKESSK